MSMGIIESGEYNKVAGLGGGNNAVRKGTVSGTTTVSGANSINVVFATPMPDADYVVTLDGESGFPDVITTAITNKTKNGFIIRVFDLQGIAHAVTYNYQAFKVD